MSTETLTNAMMAFEGDIYFGAAGSGSISPSGMTLGANVTELKLPAPGSFGEVEHTLKKHKGQKAYLKGMRDWVLNFTISKEYTVTTSQTTPPVTTQAYAADVQLVLDALQSRQPLHILLSDSTGGEGPVGDFLLWGSEYSGSGEEAQTIQVTAKPYAGGSAIKWQKNGVEVTID